MGEYVELIFSDSRESTHGNFGGVEPRFNSSCDLGNQGGLRAGWVECKRLAVTRLSISPALAYRGAHDFASQNSLSDVVRLELHCLFFRHGDHREFACDIGTE